MLGLRSCSKASGTMLCVPRRSIVAALLGSLPDQQQLHVSWDAGSSILKLPACCGGRRGSLSRSMSPREMPAAARALAIRSALQATTILLASVPHLVYRVVVLYVCA
jgi:hypothetical protein